MRSSLARKFYGFLPASWLSLTCDWLRALTSVHHLWAKCEHNYLWYLIRAHFPVRDSRRGTLELARQDEFTAETVRVDENLPETFAGFAPFDGRSLTRKSKCGQISTSAYNVRKSISKVLPLLLQLSRLPYMLLFTRYSQSNCTCFLLDLHF